MNKWISFSPEEVRKLTSNPKTMEDNTEMQCPICGRNSIRRYFHELKIGRTIGTTWYWCYNCKKYIHFTGGPLSEKYVFDDPLKKLEQWEFAELQGKNWYEYLNSLWVDKILPQTFKQKNK